MAQPPPHSVTRTRPSFHDPETEPHSKRTCPALRPEPKPSNCDMQYYEFARKQLSDYNESLPVRSLTCNKYSWVSLSLHQQENTKTGSSNETEDRNPTSRYHVGENGVEVSSHTKEKKPVLEPIDGTRRMIESMEYLITDPSISLKDCFEILYGRFDYGIRGNVEVCDGVGGGGCGERGVLYSDYEEGECSLHSRGSQDMEIVGEDSGLVGLRLKGNMDDESVRVREGDYCGFEKDGSLMELSKEELFQNDGQVFDDGVVGEYRFQDMEQLKNSPTADVPPCFDVKKSLGYSGGGPLIRPISSTSKNSSPTTDIDDSNADAIGEYVLKEDTEQFKQLVQNAFLKFVKLLYDIPALRSKLTKQEGKTTLHCNVCLSNTKSFTGAHSLLQHAFMCRTAGLRVEHLGYHKAICVLTGFNHEPSTNGSWPGRKLSNLEDLAVKQDLIIWPPVVFVHNSSITNANPVEHAPISIGRLKAFIKSIGIDGAFRVSNGKAANRSIMVLTFRATLSGLQEAEKLHKHYVDTKHGRLEFKQIASGDRTLKKEKIEDFLYGYLGTVEDLDKLDNMIKNRCFVKSKKEIHAIARETSGYLSRLC